MCENSVIPPESLSQIFFRPFGAESVPTYYPRLAPWAVILRRFAAISRLLSNCELALELRHSPLRDLNRSRLFPALKRWAMLERPNRPCSTAGNDNWRRFN